MFDKWRKAGTDAMSQWGNVLQDIRGQREVARKAPRPAMLERYMREHRGNPAATRQFAAQNVPPEQVDREVQRYVQAMEQQLRGAGAR